MLLKVRRSEAGGRVRIPGSKSHTIRALFIASLAYGNSTILHPLISADALSAVDTCRALGARVDVLEDRFLIEGVNGKPRIPEDVINVGNSGTTLRFGVMAAGLVDGCTVFTGDSQIRNRPLEPLIEAMNNLGACVFSTRGNGMAPVIVEGRLKGGKTDIDAVTSQYLSSLLIHSPLLENDTEIAVTRLNEAPYIDMTLWWLARQGIRYKNMGHRNFHIHGGQKYKSFNASIPGDFSSAVFFMVQAAISGGKFVLENLDMTDPQGDKQVLAILETMGAKVDFIDNLIIISGRSLIGREIDMNQIPDALPALAVAACFAEGETRLVNVPQARLKETDRIKVMCEELTKMGARVSELPDGLIIRRSNLRGCRVNGYNDHRIVMALAIAGLNCEEETVIDTAEAMNVTFPGFVGLLQSCGGNLQTIDEKL